MTKKKIIIEQKLGIPPDYQYKAINSKNLLQANWHKNKLVALQKLVNFNKNLTILDLGCGSGNFELFFSNQVKEILALDYNDQALEFLNNKLTERQIQNVKLVNLDIKEINKIKTDKFDLILIIDVIEHLPAKIARNLIKYLPKLLNPKGKVVVISPNYKSPWVLIEMIFDKISLVPKLDHKQHITKYYPKNLKELFLRNHYLVNEVRSFNLISFLSVWSILSNIICQFEISSRMNFGNLLIGVFTKRESTI